MPPTQIADLPALNYFLEAEIGILDSAIFGKKKAGKNKRVKIVWLLE
jgi:hypothetical protein